MATGVALMVALSGCSESTAGQPKKSGQTSESTSTETTTTTSKKGLPAYEGEALCELLTAAEAEQLGASATGEPARSTKDGHPQCNWDADTGLTVGFQQGTQSKDAPTGATITNTPTTVAGLTAVQSLETDPIEICQVIVDVTPDSVIYGAVNIQSGGEGKYQPCDVANDLVNIIIPKVIEG